MKNLEEIEDFISEKIKFQKNRFISYTSLKAPSEIGVSIEDNFEDIVIVNVRGNITREGSEYLLDNFDSNTEREILSYDKGYFRGYFDSLNDVLEFLSK